MGDQHNVDFNQHKCDRCTRVLTEEIDVDIVKQDAKAGCLFAKLALSSIQWIESKIIDNKLVNRVRLKKDGEFWTVDPSMRFEILNVQDRSSRATCLKGHMEKRLLPESTSADGTFETIHEWLLECAGGHTNCSNPSEKIPEGHLRGIRFLSLKENSILLVPNAQPKTYAALSHCWGTGTNILKTTKDNLEQHIENGIQLFTLSKTFRDAIYVCRRLGINYLWIDSLCIVQDDAIDWFEQASRMADVYKHSFVTIAATKARYSTQGCFSDIDILYQGARLNDFPNIMIRRVFGPARSFYIQSQDDRHWPLLQRGWSYQELILSSRTIHFGMQEVVWSCATEGHKCQSIPETSTTFSNLNKELRLFTPEKSMSQWHNSITAYSSRKLTFHKDRLPAIAAIAKQMHIVRPGDQYLAGLWRTTLLYDLLWHVFAQEISAEPSRQELSICTSVSSWSWASVSGTVYWFEVEKYQSFRCVELLETIFVTDGLTVSGPILEASIKLKIPLIRVIIDSGLCPSTQKSDGTPQWEDTRRLRLKSDLEIQVTRCHWDCFNNEDNLQSSYLNGPINKDDTEFDQHERDIFLVPLMREASEHGTTSRPLRTIGLRGLMVESTDISNMYRRVGIAGFQSSRGDTLATTMSSFAWDGFAEKILHQQPGEQERVIQEIEGMETHTIILI